PPRPPGRPSPPESPPGTAAKAPTIWSRAPTGCCTPPRKPAGTVSWWPRWCRASRENQELAVPRILRYRAVPGVRSLHGERPVGVAVGPVPPPGRAVDEPHGGECLSQQAPVRGLRFGDRAGVTVIEEKVLVAGRARRVPGPAGVDPQ